MQHEEAQVKQQVADNVTSVQGVFVTTARLMDERVRMSMALLNEQIGAHGGAEKGATAMLAGETNSQSIVRGQRHTGNPPLPEYSTRVAKATAAHLSHECA